MQMVRVVQVDIDFLIMHGPIMHKLDNASLYNGSESQLGT